MLDIKGLLYDTASAVTGANFRKVIAQDTVAGAEVPEGYKVILTLETPPPVGGTAVAAIGGTTGGGTSGTTGDSGTDGGSGDAGDSGDGGDGDTVGSTTTTTGGGTTSSTTSTTTTTTSGAKPILAIASASPGNFGTGLPEDTVKSINVEVVNTGLATAFCPQVTTTVSLMGVTLGSVSARLAPFSLGPGEAAFGRVIVDDDIVEVDNTIWITDGFGQYDVEYALSFENTDSSCSSFSLSVADDELITGSSGMKAVVGDVTNITSSSPIDVYVTVAALDEDGDVIEVAFVRLDYMLLGPGETTSFYAQFDYARGIDSYKIIALGETL